ncbi:3493_t:CDS:1 [Ambispora leptoticha]|uniref:3493_t:CDS:1 n=1 Tax=Ambispora leptoticha TaxID=144679 RepID=A0A9N8ZHY8_9GLOM|nr:3493_t:CDS:1 [Ambispora leptoticha]
MHQNTRLNASSPSFLTSTMIKKNFTNSNSSLNRSKILPNQSEILTDPPYQLSIELNDLLSHTQKNSRRRNQIPNAQIPRPQNAYVLFCRDFRERIKRECLCDNCAYEKFGTSQTTETRCVKNYPFEEVSKLASISWKEQSEEVKKYFHTLSGWAKEIHKIEFPGYRYSPKSSRRNDNKKSTVFIDESSKFNNSEDSDIIKEPFLSSSQNEPDSLALELSNDQVIANTVVFNNEVENSKEKIFCISETNVSMNPLDSSKNININFNCNSAFSENAVLKKQPSPKPSQNVLVSPFLWSSNEQPQLMSSVINDENNNFDLSIRNSNDDISNLYELPSDFNTLQCYEIYVNYF